MVILYHFNAHFLLYYFFFANDLLLVVYFIFILDYGNYVRKQIQVIFLFEFKMVIKQWRQLETSTIHLAQELLTNIQCSSGSRSFAKKMRPLQMKSAVAGQWESQWPTEITEADPLVTTRQVSEEPNVDHSNHSNLAFEAIWKVKRLDKRVPHELTENFLKNHCFEEFSSLSLCKSNKPFLDQIVTCDKVYFVQPAMTTIKKKLQSTFQVTVAIWWPAGLIH